MNKDGTMEMNEAFKFLCERYGVDVMILPKKDGDKSERDRILGRIKAVFPENAMSITFDVENEQVDLSTLLDYMEWSRWRTITIRFFCPRGAIVENA